MSIIREVVSWQEEMVSGQLYRFEFEPGGEGKGLVNCDGVQDFAVRCLLARANNPLKNAVEQGGYLEYRGATYNPRDGLVHGWVRRTSKPYGVAQALTTQLEAVNVTPLLAVPPRETLGGSFPLTIREVAAWLGGVLTSVTNGITFFFRRVWVVIDEGLSAVGSGFAAVGSTFKLVPVILVGIAAAIVIGIVRGGISTPFGSIGGAGA